MRRHCEIRCVRVEEDEKRKSEVEEPSTVHRIPLHIALADLPVTVRGTPLEKVTSHQTHAELNSEL